MDEEDINLVIRTSKLNRKLLRALTETAHELIIYAKENNLELPYEIEPILEKAQQYINELKQPKANTKNCSICGELNPEDATYCAYCGTTIGIISRMRHHSDNTHKGDTTACRHGTFFKPPGVADVTP